MSNFGLDMKALIVDNLLGTFPNPDKRVSVWADTDKYKWKEDADVWKQKKGLSAPQYEAHFDGEFVCFMDSAKGKTLALVDFLQGLKDLYREGKIFVHKEMYEIKKAEEEAKKEKEKLIEAPTARNEEEGLVLEAIKKSAKKRGKKVITV